MKAQNKFITFPQREDAPGVFLLAILFFIIFLLFYGGSSFVSGLVPWSIEIALPFEKNIPFLPAAAVIYLSMNLLLAIAPFVLRDLHQLFPLFLALVIQTIIASCFFILIPVENSFPEQTPNGIFGIFFSIADFLNLERNYLPSLHVSYALTAAIAYGQKTGKTGKFLLLLWVAAIAASTLLIHQHYLLDLIGAILLSLSTATIVKKWLENEQRRWWLDTEFICIENYFEFARRHPRYLLIAALITLASIANWKRRRLLRTGFCFLQAIDDILDGDRDCPEDPLDYTNNLASALIEGSFRNDKLSRLGQSFHHDLVDICGSEAVDEVISLIRVMQQDYSRANKCRLLPTDELNQHHRETFSYSVNLMLKAVGSPLRAEDVPSLIDALGWCSVIRDLEEDVDAGLINIPLEVIEKTPYIDCKLSLDLLLTEIAVQQWISEELEKADTLLTNAERQLSAVKDCLGSPILSIFARSIRRYQQYRIPRRYPFLSHLKLENT